MYAILNAWPEPPLIVGGPGLASSNRLHVRSSQSAGPLAQLTLLLIMSRPVGQSLNGLYFFRVTGAKLPNTAAGRPGQQVASNLTDPKRPKRQAGQPVDAQQQQTLGVV